MMKYILILPRLFLFGCNCNHKKDKPSKITFCYRKHDPMHGGCFGPDEYGNCYRNHDPMHHGCSGHSGITFTKEEIDKDILRKLN